MNDGPGASWEPIRAAGVDTPDLETVIEAETAPLSSPPATLLWDREFGSSEVPGRDAYALRLVTGRTLYDGGRMVASSPSIAGLAPAAALHVSATDLTRIGVAEGADVRVTSSQASLTLPVRVDSRLSAGVARLAFAVGAPGAADLIDASAMVTDLRVETIRAEQPR